MLSVGSAGKEMDKKQSPGRMEDWEESGVRL